MEKYIENKTCRQCSTSFDVTDKDLEFYKKVSPVFNGEKHLIPSPTLCPDCRQQRRLPFRNERSLYKRTCDFSGKEIISMYSPDKVHTIYEQDIWWSDSWDALDYGKDFDFSRSFFDQYRELVQEVPLPSIVNTNSERSEYTNYVESNKNCYLIFGSSNNDNCFYANGTSRSEDCVDIVHVIKSQNCYECIDCKSCNDLKYSTNSEGCSSSYFLENCVNCTYCTASKNLRNKKYCIFNKQYSKEEYFKKIEEFDLWNLTKLKSFEKQYRESTKNEINLFSQQHLCENSSWDHLFAAKNSQHCYDVNKSEDCKYIQYCVWNATDCYDISYILNSSFSYEGMSIVNSPNNIFSHTIWFDSANVIYSSFCFNNSSNLFGCIWLKSKQYCVLNKQYTKDEYESLVSKIVEHMKSSWEWWEFFPSSLSPFGYNETVANEYFPLSKQEAISKWFNWSDYNAPFPKVTKTIPAVKLPDSIEWIPDDILNWAIECEVTKKPFRIIKQELEFYRKHNLPIPKRHPDQRHMDRMSLRNPRKLYERQCDKCKKDIETTYAPERKEIVYCEECYNEAIY